MTIMVVMMMMMVVMMVVKVTMTETIITAMLMILTVAGKTSSLTMFMKIMFGPGRAEGTSSLWKGDG